MIGRSTRGCWTCRLRRKKCDEHHPICQTCASLELSCEGYGPKPHWMDNGPKQKEQALIVKRAVSETKSNRKKRRVVRRSEESSEKHNSPLKSISQQSSPIPVVAPEKLQNVISDQLELPELEAFGDPWDLPFDSNLLLTTSIFNDETSFTMPTGSVDAEFEWEAGLYACSDRTSTQDSTDTNFGAALENCLPRADVCVNSDPTVSMDFDDSSAFSIYCGGLEPEQAIAQSRPIPRHVPPARPLSLPNHSGPLAHSSSRMSGLSEPAQSTKQPEDELLMHYLDHTFYIQYPFYAFSDMGGRAWIYSILKERKLAFHVALALSDFDQRSSSSQMDSKNLNMLRVKDGYYDLASTTLQQSMAESHSWRGIAGLELVIQSLTCILQLLSLQLLTGGTEDWALCLRTASDVIPWLEEAYKTPAKPGDPLYTHRNAITSLLGYFITTDIISSTSTRSKPILPLDHKSLIARDEICLIPVIGCQNWVMSSIFEICLLENWKKDSEQANNLNVVELVRRSNKIEHGLRHEINAMDSTILHGPVLGNNLPTLSTPNPDVVTRIFALAAIIYLHVIVSGASPELAEITDCVSQIVTAYRASPKLIRHTIWPFCIAGCLVPDSEQGAFRGFVSAAGVTDATPGTCFGAFQVMEKYWQERDSQNCDWASIMSQSGKLLLLM